MLQLNTTLTKLELSGNSIDYDGAAALAEALAQNTSLQALSIRSLLRPPICQAALSLLPDSKQPILRACCAHIRLLHLV